MYSTLPAKETNIISEQSLLVIDALLEANQALFEAVSFHVLNLLEVVLSLRTSHATRESGVSQGIQRLDRHICRDGVCWFRIRRAFKCRECLYASGDAGKAHCPKLLALALEVLVENAGTVWVGSHGDDAASFGTLDDAAVRGRVPLAVTAEILLVACVDCAGETATL
jgi:hypothetical protein